MKDGRPGKLPGGSLQLLHEPSCRIIPAGLDSPRLVVIAAILPAVAIQGTETDPCLKMVHRAANQALVHSIREIEELDEGAGRHNEAGTECRASHAAPGRVNPKFRGDVRPVPRWLAIDEHLEAANHGWAEADILYDARVAIVARVALNKIGPDGRFGLVAAQAGLVHGSGQRDNGDYRRGPGDNTVGNVFDALFHPYLEGRRITQYDTATVRRPPRSCFNGW